MKESKPSDFNIRFPERIDGNFSALKGGFFVDPENTSPLLKISTRKFTILKVLKEHTVNIEEISEN